MFLRVLLLGKTLLIAPKEPSSIQEYAEWVQETVGETRQTTWYPPQREKMYTIAAGF